MSLVGFYSVLVVLLVQLVGTLAAPVPLYIDHGSLSTRKVQLARSAENPAQDDTACNGHPELCDRKYGNTTFLGSHDSFAVSPHWFALSRTQEVSLEDQMKMGVRMLQAQGRMHNGALHFCHTSCILFDGGTVEAYLLKVKKFLEENPREVMTFVFTNPEEVSVEKVWKPVFEKTGMDKLAYIPPQPVMGRDDWPTLREFIDSGRRVVVFLDKGADERKEPEKEYILPQFKMMWEDPHNPTDTSFPCNVDRTQGPLLPTDQLYLINHNLNVNILPIGWGLRLPARASSEATNNASSVVSHAYGCAGDVMEERNPNFVMLDFVNVGGGMKAVETLNGF